MKISSHFCRGRSRGAVFLLGEAELRQREAHSICHRSRLGRLVRPGRHRWHKTARADFEMEEILMSKKPTPTRKTTVDASQKWPKIYEDVGHGCALEAIQHGNRAILVRYLREADEIDPRVRRELAEMLNATSNHSWRLDARYRFRGKPTKQGERDFNETIVNLTKLFSGAEPLDPRCPRTLADMLDPDLHGQFRFDLKQRKRGRPPLKSPRKYWGGIIPDPIDIDPATLLVRDAADRVREAEKSGSKIPLKQLHDRTSRSTFYRRWDRCKPHKPAGNPKPRPAK